MSTHDTSPSLSDESPQTGLEVGGLAFWCVMSACAGIGFVMLVCYLMAYFP